MAPPTRAGGAGEAETRPNRAWGGVRRRLQSGLSAVHLFLPLPRFRSTGPSLPAPPIPAPPPASLCLLSSAPGGLWLSDPPGQSGAEGDQAGAGAAGAGCCPPFAAHSGLILPGPWDETELIQRPPWAAPPQAPARPALNGGQGCQGSLLMKRG